MANTTISPNMNMPVPVVGTDPGPDWATNVNSCLSIIDSHNHTPGQGVQITPSGMDISSDLPMGSNNLTTARSVRFDAQSAPLALAADLGCLYESGVDLYYNDGLGNQVRITQSGSVTGSSGTITGLPSGTASASYAAGTFTFQGATNTPATMNVGPIITGAAVANSKTVTISPSAVLAADYALTWPLALPASSSYLLIDASGNMSLAASPGTIASGTYTPTLTWTGATPGYGGSLVAYYTRVGAIVHLAGEVQASSATSTTLSTITLPIATAAANNTGAGTFTISPNSASCTPSPANISSGAMRTQTSIITVGAGETCRITFDFTYQIV